MLVDAIAGTAASRFACAQLVVYLSARLAMLRNRIAHAAPRGIMADGGFLVSVDVGRRWWGDVVRTTAEDAKWLAINTREGQSMSYRYDLRP